MTRLYDRLTQGCPPFRLADLLAGTPFEERIGQQLGSPIRAWRERWRHATSAV